MAILVIGAIYQLVAARLDEGKYLPPGQMVDVGGHRLHLYCTGEGSPTVILEAGLGGGMLDWSLVQPEVAKFTRVCSYDRAGVAWSEAGQPPRDAAAITDELHRLLTAADVKPPYVLAGHSLGGPYCQLYAAKYPSEVVGMVLVDSSTRDQISRVGGIPPFVPYLLKAAATVGVVRIAGHLMQPPPELSIETNATRNALYSRTRHGYAVADEMTNVPVSLQELDSSPLDFGDKPLIVLARGLPDGFSPDVAAAWRELQMGLGRLSTKGKLVVAQNSGHYIHFSEPNLVIGAIREVVSASAIR